MATVYKVEIVSDWINYTEEELKKVNRGNFRPRQTKHKGYRSRT